MSHQLRIVTTKEELAHAAAAEFVKRCEAAVHTRGVCAVALAGGSTPKGMYELLAQDRVLGARMPWRQTHFFWGDERHAPPEHPDSNYRMAYAALLSQIPIPPENIHRIKSEGSNIFQAADEYEGELRTFFGSQRQLPRFDLLLLGMGTDGHIASLFPNTEALAEHQRWVVATHVENLSAYRITLTFPVLNAAACILVLVSGKAKAATLQAVCQKRKTPATYPAQGLHPSNGELIWIVDSEAAQLLTHKR